MDANNLSAIEIDAIGEILNISLGASATAVSSLLNARVDITTPIVNVKSREEFEFSKMEPAVGVEIGYVEGLDGSNIMLLKREDVKVIVEMLMGMEMADEEFELDEMNISAVCEVMNQMMGASATALSELLSKTVNISTPVSFEVSDPEKFKEKYFVNDERMVVIQFSLNIMDKMDSEFLNLMPIGLARELVSGFFPDGVPGAEPAPAPAPAPSSTGAAQPSGGVMSQEEIERMMQGASGGAAAPSGAGAQPSGGVMSQEEIERMLQGASGGAAAPSGAGAQPSGGVMSQEEIERMMQGMSGANAPMQGAMPMQGAVPMQGAAQPIYSVPAMDPTFMKNMMEMMDMMRQSLEQQQQQIRELAPKRVKVNPMPQPNLRAGADEDDSGDNLDLMMDVPMELTVEIGRTRKLVRDILELNKGSLVVLDKLAGEQVDLFVNGQYIAKGDVVVVDDNFGIRITEIL